MADILIKGGTVITMNSRREVIENGAVAIEKNHILDVGDSARLLDAYDANIIIDAKKKIILPGLMDGHAHAGHSLLRGLGMHNDVWYKACEVFYSQASNEDFWYADGLLLNLERLKFGTTTGMTFMGGGDSVMRVDDPVYTLLHCKAAEEIGVREYVAVGPRRPPYPSLYSNWSGDARRDHMISFEEQITTCNKIVSERKQGEIVKVSLMFPTSHPEIKPITGVHLVDLKEQANIIRDISRRNKLLFTQDGHSRGTIKFCHDELGFTGPDALLSHSTELTAEEIRICAETGTKIVHNPNAVASIMGRCPVPELIDAGVTVMLGSDAGAPDRSFDMFRHMFQSMRYHRRHYRDDRILPPGKVLEMATIDAAKGFGVEKELGSIESGKKADLLILDAYKPHLYPLNMPVDRVTYFASGSDVDTVIVDGNILMEGRKVLTIDEYRILDLAQEQLEAAVGRSKLKNLFDLTEGYWGKSRY